MKARRMKELKEIFSKFHDDDLFWIEKGMLIIKSGDKNTESYGDVITLKQVLELY